ncbi:MAG: YceI family protein [Actinomycetota bacterium]
MSTSQTHTTPALPTGSWRLDPERTTVTVTATKLGFYKVPATIAVVSGTIEIDADHQVAGVEVVADAASYTSANPKRNDHVRSADFLDAEQHPELVFRADRAEPTGTGYRATGSVTVKGRTVELGVEIGDVEFDDQQGSFTASATIDRTAIGVDKLPSLVIGNDLLLTVTAVATTD